MSLIRFNGATEFGAVATATVLDLTARWLGVSALGLVCTANLQDLSVPFSGATSFGLVGVSVMSDGQIINTVLLQGVASVGVVGSSEALLGFVFPVVETPAGELDMAGSAMGELSRGGSVAGEVT